ncbi:MAG TPA: hypothetical protein VHD56_08270 [Tepidisphaeraceae bacterium]|nr:hypothetical protein [Tepidisphaeraceae bacterium]
MKFKQYLAAGLFAMILAASVRADEIIDNPQYQSWAKHKPGTSVTLQSDMVAGTLSQSRQTMQTLVSIDENNATVQMTMDMGPSAPALRQISLIPAKVEKSREGIPLNYAGTLKEIGKETVQIAGKSYNCVVTEFTGRNAQGTAVGKFWRTVEIPGGMAKMELTVTARGTQNLKTTVLTMELK